MKRLSIFVLLGVLWAGCTQQEFNGALYSSFRQGNEYVYSHAHLKSVVQSEKETPEGIEYVVVSLDSAGNELMREVYIKQGNRLLWKELDGTAMGMLRYSYDPPLWAVPFSDQMGKTDSYVSQEARSDAQKTRLRIRVDTVIENIEAVRVAAGNFPACIKVKSTITYLDSTSSPFIQGDARWWYARGMGVVKYQTPEGDGELVSAKIDGRILPKKPVE